MNEITVEMNAPMDQLTHMGVFDWPIWEKGASDFPWNYDAEETCYLLEGEVTVTPDGGDPVSFSKGDLVTFPRGMSCRWTIHQAVRKHYTFA